MENPDILKKNIEIYNDQFYFLIDDLENSYVNAMLYPDNNEYQQIYSVQLGMIETIKTNTFVLTNNVQKNIDTLNTLLKEINTKIKNEQIINSTLKTENSSFKSDGNGSELMKIESKQVYNIQRYTNMTMLFGIFLILTTIVKINS